MVVERRLTLTRLALVGTVIAALGLTRAASAGPTHTSVSRACSKTGPIITLQRITVDSEPQIASLSGTCFSELNPKSSFWEVKFISSSGWDAAWNIGGPASVTYPTAGFFSYAIGDYWNSNSDWSGVPIIWAPGRNDQTESIEACEETDNNNPNSEFYQLAGSCSNVINLHIVS